MEMRCADCGCLVDRKKVVERCSEPDCCCNNLSGKGKTVTTPNPEAEAELVDAIHRGDIESVQRLIAVSPELVNGPLGGPSKTRSALHIVTD